MSAEAAWRQELEKPTEAFFAAFAARVREEDGLRDGVREAVKVLVPLLDWPAYLPHFPHGLLGLRAAFRLRPLLGEASFLRLMATQLHYFAHEGRRFRAHAVSKGSGAWPNIELALDRHKPDLAYGEFQGLEEPEDAHFRRLAARVEGDMANMGHKAVLLHRLRELFADLDRPKATGRRLLGIGAWLAASEPVDFFWTQRAEARLKDSELRVDWESASMEDPEGALRELCDLGLVELLNRFSARLRAGAGGRALLAALVRAASEKLLDARRDLEGKTSWALVFLATFVEEQAPAGDPRAWCRAAALVNLFPTDEAEDRPRPAEPQLEPSAEALADAILDVEPLQAMGLAQALVRRGEAEAALRGLAEAASQNDPTFNYAHQILAVAAAADLLPLLPAEAAEAMLVALAKSLANSQGSSDLGRLAMRAISL